MRMHRYPEWMIPIVEDNSLPALLRVARERIRERWYHLRPPVPISSVAQRAIILNCLEPRSMP